MGRADGEDDRELSEVPRVPLRGARVGMAPVVAVALGIAGCETAVIGIEDAPSLDAPSSHDVHTAGIDGVDTPIPVEEDTPPPSSDVPVAGLDAIDSPPPVEPDAPPSDDEP